MESMLPPAGALNPPALSCVECCYLLRSQVNRNLMRRQERVVNKAVMHGAHQALRLFFRERDGAQNMHAEVADAGRLFQFLGGHCDLYACQGEIARLQILHGIEGRART